MTRAKGNFGSVVVEVIRKVYEKSIVFYPSEIRRDFGAEMVEVFDEQISEAYSRSGFSGLLRVWFSATRELLTIALPGRLGERMVPIVAVTAAWALMMWFAGYTG